MAGKSNQSWLICKTTIARVSSIDVIFDDIIDSQDEDFRQIAYRLIGLGGKRLRPALFFLSTVFGETYFKEFLFPAAALELLHTASLYHDDVIDRADTRRKQPSVNSIWGNDKATFAGTYLFSKAISIFANCGYEINRMACKFVSDLCLGELKEVENAYNISININDHMDIIGKKTASLFEFPCLVGASLSEASISHTNNLRNFGRDLGLVFQLTDDLLDLTGDPLVMGKDRGVDLREGVYSYATIHALSSPDHAYKLSKILLYDSLSAEDIDEAIYIITDSGGIDEAKKKIEFHTKRAIESLETLPECPSKTSLINLAESLGSRDN